MKNLNFLTELSQSQIKAERCKRSFYFFFKEFWETIEAVPLIDNWHIKYICDKLQDSYNKWELSESQEDILINIPPGSSKSTICTQLFPVWLWVKNPSIRIISSSYSDKLSTAHAVKSRDCIASDKFNLYFSNIFDMKTGEDNKTWYKNSKKGERFATSTGGSVTGVHADFIIIDDPLNVKKAASEAEREQASKHVFETLSSRKTDKKRSVTIIIMQRLHEKDVAGVLLKKKPVTHICLPGELSNITTTEARDFYKNGLLDPNRLDRDALETIKKDLGTYAYAGQIGQDPTPEGGGILKKEWFKKVSKEEFFLKYFKNGKKTIVLDTAYTEYQKNDPTASLSCCFYENIHYIYNAREMWLEFPDLIKKIKGIALEDNIDNGKILVEPKASGKSIVQTLKNSTLNVIELPPPKDDKYTRVYDISADVEAGKVVLVEGDWNDSFIHQCITFPNAEHDDMLDCLVYQINYCKLAPKAPKLTMSGYVR